MDVVADLAANVWKIVVAPGDHVSAGSTLIILESMKMEIPVEAPIGGTIVSVACKEGDLVKEGQLLLCLE